MATILHVIDTTGPGGAETIFVQLAEKTAVEGHRSIAVIRGKGWVYDELSRRKIDTQVVDCKGSFNLLYLFRLVRLIRHEKVDVIQSHLLGSNVYCSLAGFITGSRVVSTFHGMVDISPSERFRAIKLIALRLGSFRIVTVTKGIESLVKRLPILKKGSIETIYNGINIAEYEKINASGFREFLGVAEDDFLVGSLGNIRKPKNYPLAIETIKELHNRGLKVHYAIAGQGNDEQMEPLTELVSYHGLKPYVHFIGFTRKTQEFLSSLDVFLMTSSSEGHPLALTQAMANGLPIVTTRSGVQEIVVDKKEALISELHSAASLADLLEVLAGSDRNQSLIGIDAKQKAMELYSLDAMYDSYFKLYGFSLEKASF
jgi:glycosyltransferase involved in cell wall biosynthesis